MQRKLAIVAGLVVLVAAWAAPAAADPGRGADVICYFWAHDATSAIGVPYTPSTAYSYNQFGRATVNSVTRTGNGVYVATCSLLGGGVFNFSQSGGADAPSVAIESVDTDSMAAGAVAIGDPAVTGSWGVGGHVQVTAYGSEDADHCKVVSWATGGPHFTVNVRCYNHAGALSNNRFDLLIVW
jgi:hypothetical protein